MTDNPQPVEAAITAIQSEVERLQGMEMLCGEMLVLIESFRNRGEFGDMPRVNQFSAAIDMWRQSFDRMRLEPKGGE